MTDVTAQTDAGQFQAQDGRLRLLKVHCSEGVALYDTEWRRYGPWAFVVVQDE